ncbi:glycosyltransferase family 4 protein [Aequorivita sp. SDUM287046]|uniref:Glycosyltransferase family 4 protein n=1 Tax=Aequorivita aurantiaca TaxID=3053356 RepID=A0ABT8DLE2_9FLAO|nr:glycosyltransferase family 4 protein [Aequorivita aurantiaca]MDN3723965.1 glycosyltransferase family 4 protein [Aequorivita aurantiaca]
MKLLYITNGINGSGGLERVLSIKASYLAEHYGYEVSILCLNNNHLNPFYIFSKKIQMYSIPVGGSIFENIFEYKRGIKSIVRDVQPDVISVCDDGLKGFFVPLIIREKIPIIYERHASINLNFNKENKGIFFFLQAKLQYNLMKNLATNFEKFIVLTKSNLKEWKGDNLSVIPNALSFYPKESAALDTKKIIVVGSHSYNKGYDLLFLTWKKVAEVYKDWTLNIYGMPDINNTFKKKAEKMGLIGSVNFYDPVKNIKSKYLNSSIMVLPSRSEGFGMVIIEAMACGIPCVSFNCPHGPADIIHDGIDGYLVKNGNIESLAEKLITLIENQTLRKEMGARGRENVQRYLPENIVKEWDELFHKLI